MPFHRSWLPSANAPACGFPLANLPLCSFRPAGSAQPYRIGTAIGDAVLDLRLCVEQGLLPGLDEGVERACTQDDLTALFALGRPAMRSLRIALTEALREGATMQERTAACLLPQAQVEHALPAAIGDYTDFLTSYHHAFNVGSLFRPDQPVLPNFKSLPIAYHGRSSSVAVSGEPVPRPQGQFRVHHGGEVAFGPTRRLDFEMELGAFIGKGNARGQPIAVDDADAHIAGICILNDWSARDIQAWESQPLGPFQGKNFATTISPWVVTLEALAPYRVPAAPRAAADPPLFDYLRHQDGAAAGFEIHVETRISTARMRAAGAPEHVVSRSLFSRDTYWTFGQMIAHHTVNGCNLRAGDLVGSGTLSGPTPGTEGSLLEGTRGGAQPLQLPDGETRSFLQDGDEVVLSAWCERPGLPRIGFGECRGRILTAAPDAA